MINKPVEIMALGDKITVKEGPVEGDGLGYFDPETGTVVIEQDQPEFGKFSILLHELLHVTEMMLMQNKVISERIDGAFVTAAPFGIATILVHMGIIQGIGEDQWMEFLETEGVTEDHPEVTQEDIDGLQIEHEVSVCPPPMDDAMIYLNRNEEMDHSIRFQVAKVSDPVLEIKEDGDFLVRGEKVENDREIYVALKNFLEESMRDK